MSAHANLAARPAAHRVVSKTMATAALRVLSLLLGFATSLVLARVLGDDGYGQYVFALAWAGLLGTPAALGLDRYAVRGVAVYEERGDWRAVRGLLRRSHGIVVAVSSGLAALGALVGLLFVSGPLAEPFVIAMGLVPLTAVTLLRQGAMQALGKVTAGQLPEYLVRPALILAVVGALAVAGALTPSAALAGTLASGGVAALLGFVLLKRSLPAAVASASPDYRTRAWLRASLPMMAVGGIVAANYYLATLLVGFFAGPGAAGVYSVAERGASLIAIAYVAGNMALAPVVARLHARRDMAGIERESVRVARVTFLLSAPLVAALVVAPGSFLALFGSEFEAGSSALIVLALAQWAHVAAGPAGYVLMMTGHERVASAAAAVGVLVTAAVGALCVPLIGVPGGAAGFAAGLISWDAFLIVAARRRLGVNVTAVGSLDMVGR